MSLQKRCSSINVSLHRDDSGLSLKKKRKNSISYIFISKFASKGLLFETIVPQKCIPLLFPYLSAAVILEELSFFIVACNSGEIFVVLVEKAGTGDSVKVGQIQAVIVWADFVKDELLILEHCGKLHIGNMDEVIKWKSITLSVTPLCCIALEDFLVLSDGFSSYLYELDTRVSDCTVLLRLPYFGVIGLRKSSSHVVLNTCDGRKYTKSLSFLKEDSKKFAKELEPSSLLMKNINLSGIMKAIKRYSDCTRDKKTELDRINLYLEQTAFAQSFLAEPPKTPFSVQLSVLCVEEDKQYILSIQLKQIVSRIILQGSWWQLNVKLKGCCTVSCLYTDVIDINNGDSFYFIKFKVPFSFVDNFISTLNQEVKIEFNLTFSHFSTMKPLCTFRIHEENLDVLHFLSSVSGRNLPADFSSSFDATVTRLFGAPCGREDRKEKHIAPHEHVSVLLRRKLLPILESLFPKLAEEEVFSWSCTKWLRRDMVKLACDKADSNFYKVSIEGTSRLLITAIKLAIEKRAFKYQISDTASVSKIKLQREHYRKVLITKTILNLETSTECPSDVAVQRIWSSLNDLISSIFL